MARRTPDPTLRIIGGNWRGRKISFANQSKIRPTPDRVRETLFNWLTPHIQGSHCLDLFAGSGILSIEALSRGAAHVVLVDHSRIAVNPILNSLSNLGASEDSYQCIVSDAEEWLDSSFTETFNIVFLDPPFENTNPYTLTTKLAKSGLMKDHSFVYIETPAPLNPDQLPEIWHIIKQKKAGAVHYCLCETVPGLSCGEPSAKSRY